MKALATLACLACGIALAQRPDCPPRDAPPPSKPPGEPPAFTPPLDFPKSFDQPPPAPEAAVIPRPRLTAEEKAWLDRQAAERAANDGYLRADDAHVAGLLHMMRVARPMAAPAHAIDVSRTALRGWDLQGTVPEMSPHHLTRLFRRADGTLLGLTEFRYRAAGGAVYRFEGTSTTQVATHPAILGGVKGPSGCVASTLSWSDDRRHFKLEIAGVLAPAAQRATLLSVAESIAAAAREAE